MNDSYKIIFAISMIVMCFFMYKPIFNILIAYQKGEEPQDSLMLKLKESWFNMFPFLALMSIGFIVFAVINKIIGSILPDSSPSYYEDGINCERAIEEFLEEDTDKWECVYCLALNPKENVECHVCKAPRKARKILT